eukprot:24242-Eustigmatos_ZCMA.PRE.1
MRSRRCMRSRSRSSRGLRSTARRQAAIASSRMDEIPMYECVRMYALMYTRRRATIHLHVWVETWGAEGGNGGGQTSNSHK